MSAIIPVARMGGALSLAETDLAWSYAIEAKSPRTRRAYQDCWRAFTEWCGARGLVTLPASTGTVAGFLAACAANGLAVSSINQRAAAIRYAHKLKGLEPPTTSEEVKATLAGIRRTLGTTPTHRKEPVVADKLGAMLAHCPDTLLGKRDRALLTLGFAGAFRRSELVALEVSDLEETPDGLRVTVRRSKTDQEGRGQHIAVPRGYRLRPVEALQSWLAAAAITEGPIFRPVGLGDRLGAKALTPWSVPVIVKRYCALAGLDSAEFSSHSLRSGFLTSAAEAGASVFKMMEVSRHKSVDTLSGYVRRADLFREHAGATFL
jgi:integrase